VPTQASFRFVHGAGSLEEQEPLDLYLRLPGETVDFDDDETAPSVSSLTYQTASSYFTLKEGDYEILRRHLDHRDGPDALSSRDRRYHQPGTAG
jgi:hypothetical protein